MAKGVCVSFNHEESSLDRAILVNGKGIKTTSYLPSFSEFLEGGVFVEAFCKEPGSMIDIAELLSEQAKEGFELASFSYIVGYHLLRLSTRQRRLTLQCITSSDYDCISKMIEDAQQEAYTRLCLKNPHKPNNELIADILALILYGGVEYVITHMKMFNSEKDEE